MKIIGFVFLLILHVEVGAQQAILKGFIHSTAGRAVQGASVLVRKNDSSAILAFAISQADGGFLVKSIPGENNFLEIRHISYETIKICLDSAGICCRGDVMIAMSERTKELKEIVIKREAPIITRNDTIVFNANSFKTPETRKVEDLLKNIQGFTVDGNGKLSFNGKAVDRVLIEGDDLADRGYQLITRNLDASLIEKVEVVDNFNTNRLMRNVERTNKVGINLRIASKFKAKLSGSGELGASVNNRYVADVNNIFIGRKFKWMGFGSYNNVARDPSGNVRYYYQQEGGQGTDEDISRPTQAVLETGSFSIPAIGERYVKNNSDFGLAFMNTWRIGKYTRVNTLVGFNDLSLQNQTESLVATEISDQEKWVLNNVMDLRKRSSDMLFQGSIQTDKGKNHVRRLNFGYQLARDRNHFSDLLSGAANDSLREEIKNNVSAIRFSWQETFLLKKKVFRVSVDYAKGYISQFLDNRSARYLSFWGVDSSYLRNLHQFDQNRQFLDLQLRMNGNKRLFQFEYGASIQHRDMAFLSRPSVLSDLQKPDIEPDPNFDEKRVFQVKGIFKGGVKTSINGRLSINGEMGFEKWRTNNLPHNFGIFNGSVIYIHSFSLLRSLKLGYSVYKGFSDYDKLYPVRLLSGSGIILNGIVFDGAVGSHAWTTAFYSNNFYKQRSWSLTLNYKLLPRAYTIAVTTKPELNEFGFGLARDNRLFNGLFSWESFVKSIKGRVGARAGYNMSKFRSMLNGMEGSSNRFGLNAEGWWNSGFNFPLNMELKAGFYYTTGRWNDGELNANWQYHWSTKLKLKSERRMYTAVSWNGFLLSECNQFFGLDLFATYPVSKTIIVSLTGVNLLNSGRVIEKTVMPYHSSQSMFYLVERYVLVSAQIGF